MTSASDVPADLSVYIHWPYCARICPYCDFNVYRARGREAEAQALTAAIAQDLRGHAERMGARRLTTVFFGGGTPSLMAPDQVAELTALCRALWPPAANGAVEITLEANPTDAEAERFRDLAGAGVNRLSLGVQSLDDAELAFLGRNHGAAEARRALRLAGTAFSRLSMDLIYALPGQSAKAWVRALEQAADLGAEHISPYQLTIEPGTAFHRAATRGRFTPPDADLAADLFEITQTRLEDLGFDAYEVSNHARGVAARSLHNLQVWRGREYVGVGPGAHGRVVLDGQRRATEAAARPDAYRARVSETGVGWTVESVMTLQDVAEERLLMGLRTVEGVGWRDLAPLGIGPDHLKVRSLGADGLISADEVGLIATGPGRTVLDHICRNLILP